MGALLMLATALLLLALGGAFVLLLAAGRRTAALGTATAGVAVAAAYAALLFGTSLRSRPVVLGPGTAKRFCGFYLDCHLGVAALRLRAADRIGDAVPAGRFVIVTIRIESDAVRATLAPARLAMILEDDLGLTHGRSAAGEEAWRRAGGDTGPLERPVRPEEHYTVDVVFDVPRVWIGSSSCS